VPKNFPVGISFKGLDKVSKVINKITSKFPKLTRAVKRTSTAFKGISMRTEALQKKLSKIGGAMTRVGKNLSMKLTLPIVAFGAFALRAAGNFEAAMKDVQGKTGLEGTSDKMKELIALAKELGKTTQFSAGEVADAMAFLAQAGLSADEIIKGMSSTINLAAATNIELAEAGDIATNVLKGYGMEVAELTKLNNFMVKATNKANMNIQELAESMKVAGPIFASQNVPLEQTIAIFGKMADAGIKAGDAGTGLKKAMSSLLNITPKAVAVFKKLKIPSAEIFDATGKVADFSKVLMALEKSGASAGDLIKIFGERAGPKLIPLLTDGIAKVNELANKVLSGNNGVGEAAKIAALKMEGFNGAIKSFKSAVESVMLAVADSGLMKFVQDFIIGLTSMLRDISALNPTILKWGTILAGTAAIIGPLLVVVGSLITSISFLIIGFKLLTAVGIGLNIAFWPFTLTVGAITAGIILLTAAIALLVLKWDWVKEKLVGGWNYIKDGFWSAMSWISEKIKYVTNNWVTLVVMAVFKIAQKIRGLISMLPFGGGIASLLGYGAGLDPQSAPAPAPTPATGQPIGAKAIQSSAAQNYVTRTNNASVNVNFSNLPENASIEADNNLGPLQVSQGLSGL
jgi:TP901 family phage tail tape measure protein